ncbi:hypothetical protein [Mesoterricola silvestris]|uniref:Response regulatory domain-containing protein n=1 Tax=Mesoterricola silvestris TaxID=2927979 RepID=A0AA48KAS1_9BACT|nr:hypothetical protein [Mesoterricola silvestris]BDU73597.1 hypothetical protein METEAL_27710 [Mesoterricola silvestris]
MTPFAPQPELRDEGTIRAYLEELARLKAPVQFWLPVNGALPFDTSLEQVGRTAFSTTTTPLLEPGQTLRMAFMLDARRFTALTRAEGTGIFGIPSSLAQGERRSLPRAAFGRGERAEVFAVEFLSGPFPWGRTLQGRLLDLSPRGLRLSLDEFDSLGGPVKELKPGDRFQAVRVSGLPHMPPIQGTGTLVHLTGRDGGMILEGLSPIDVQNLERILAPRLPPSFGQGFPDRKPRTDPADVPGAPTPTRVKARPAEVVERPLERPAPEPEPRPQINAALRLRKASKRILLLSTTGSTHALAQAFREDGFRQVHEARSFQEARTLAASPRVDLVLLDNTMGGHWAKDMMRLLRGQGLLVDTPVILVVEYRNTFAWDVAEALGACHIHERRESYQDLVPVVERRLFSPR